MNILKLIFFAITLTIGNLLFAQVKSNLNEKEILVTDSIIKLDSIIIIPGSVIIYDSNGKLIPSAEYIIDNENATIKFINNNFSNQSLKIVYRKFPYNFLLPYYHKRFEDYRSKAENKVYIPNYLENKPISFSENDGLEKRGSISRGISFGNNQDVIVNSNLNLQLSGKLSPDINIIAAISDNNIPIQPDGNTQQIQEFDKVFITLFNEKNRLTVGDFEVTRPNGYFLNLNRKVQGATFSTISEKPQKYTFKSSVSGSVSKGKYCRQQFNGTEGNQGPYKLKGCENETYIIVLSGSERIFIDGKLLTRGQDNDYVIDYNSGEITFTPKQIITKDKRITIEFEYSEKSYARFLVLNSNVFESKKSKFWLNIFSENDNKNQSFQQDLSDSQKQLLSAIGDSINQAFVPNIDTVEFSNNQVLYKKIDTTINSVLYKDIYVYSNNSDSAKYRLGFSFVGKNRGNYAQVTSNANGKVYKWIEPLNGISQGSFEPIVLLITPKKKQMLTFGSNTQISKTLKAQFETAISNNDINSFSDKDSKDNTGIAFKLSLINKFNVNDTTKKSILSGISYEFTSDYFSEVEAYRLVEFSRDWNLGNYVRKSNEHNLNYYFLYNLKNKIFTRYDFDIFNSESLYNGIKNNLKTDFLYKGFNLNTTGSYLNSNGISSNTEFLRQKAIFSKTIKNIVIGVGEEQEINRWTLESSDSLLLNSFSFNKIEAFIKSNDTLKNSFFVHYDLRNDFKPVKNTFSQYSQAQNFAIGGMLAKNQNHIIKTTINYRILTYTNIDNLNLAPENNLTARAEYSMKFFKGAITSSFFYEIGTGLELKREFSYIEVAQGQGVYSWTDYNSNNIKELDEFEVSAFQDQANYIRIFTPTNEYIKTYLNQYNHIINIYPQRIWFNKTGFLKFLAKFSDQAAFRINRKTTNDNIFNILNPFDIESLSSSSSDTTLVSLNSSARNTFSFNRTGTVWGIDYITQGSKNKMLLINGFDLRTIFTNGLKARWNINQNFTIEDYIQKGNKIYNSEYFSSKNYTINIISNEATVSIQPGQFFRTALTYQYSEKINTEGVQKALNHNAGLELRFSSPQKGNLTATFNYIKIYFNDSPNSSVGYEMLEGLLPGNNFTWTIMFQRNLTESLQLNLNYNARKPGEEKIVHTGGVQLRAFF